MEAKTDRKLVRVAGKSKRYLLVRFSAPESLATRARPRVTVSLVLDRSGSMAGEKLRLVQRAAAKALEMLRADDLFSLVVYDDRVDLLVASTEATLGARRNAERRLGGIDARGTTDLASGWLRGCGQVASTLSGDSVGKCLLLTDGLANVGITDPRELLRHAGELRKRQVLTSTFGVGSDFDEMLLHDMAAAGGGHFYFIDSARQVVDFLTSELGETLEVVARDVGVVLEFPKGVGAEVLSEFPSEAEGGRLRCELGNLVSGQQVSVLLAVTFPAGAKGESAEVGLRVVDQDRVFGEDAVVVQWEYAGHRANDSQPRDAEADRVVAAVYAERARREALVANRRGDYREAARILKGTARRIKEYAGKDGEMLSCAEGLEIEQSDFAAPMTSMALKQRHFASTNALRGRDAKGRARRPSTHEED